MIAIELTGTTDASGALTVTATQRVNGLLYGIRWIDGTFDDGVDAVISTVGAEASGTVLTLTNANDDAWYHPRNDSCTNAGVSLSSGDVLPVVVGKPKMVVSSGGNVKTGGCILYILE